MSPQIFLHLSKGFSLPADAVTQTIAIIAKRRAGKSYLARRFAEQLHKASQQIVIVDPKGDWWGIRAAADGKGRGLPIVIFGGERGDVPLEPRGGELVAKLIVEDQVSALLDLSLFRKHEVATFMTAFLETIYRLKALEKNRTPVMLFVDEADAIAPQKPQENEARMLGAAEDIVRRGGQRGIGCTLITQRSAVLSKNVLTQAEILIALRTISPQDLKALEAWIDVHGTDIERGTLMQSLPSLPLGDAWVWSPGWPTKDGIFERIHTLPIETWDSGATPKPWHKPVQPKSLADVDLAVVRKQMAATIEEAKANDPRALRARIGELEKELAKERTKKAPTTPATKVERVEVPALSPKEFRALEKTLVKWEEFAAIVIENAQRSAQNLTRILDAVEQGMKIPKLEPLIAGMPIKVDGEAFKVTHRDGDSVTVARQTQRATTSNGTLGKGERTVLIAVAQHRGGVSREQITVLTSYKRSTRDLYLQRLAAAGMIDRGDPIRVTPAGIDELGRDFEPLPTGGELREYWMQKLPAGERAVLELLCKHYPNRISAETISENTLYKRSTRDLYLQRLASRKLIVRDHGYVRASELLF